MNVKGIRKKIKGVGKRIGLLDDFNWSIYYEDEYSKQIAQLEKEFTFVLSEGKYSLNNGKIILEPGLLPLNDNHQALYEAVYALKPNSVLEIGCGCGDHLVNLKRILPQIELKGLDISQKQLNFLFSRHPELKYQAQLLTQDITKNVPELKKNDLVFTQAVLMHIQRYTPYFQALRNIFQISDKYIVLMENWTRHNFVKDIKMLAKKSYFSWDSIYFYKYDTGKQIALILSKTPLAIFDKIEDNKELLKYFNYG